MEEKRPILAGRPSGPQGANRYIRKLLNYTQGRRTKRLASNRAPGVDEKKKKKMGTVEAAFGERQRGCGLLRKKEKGRPTLKKPVADA